MGPSEYLELTSRIESCKNNIINLKSGKAKKDLMIMLNHITRFHSTNQFDLISSLKKGKLTPKIEELLRELIDLVSSLEQYLLIAALTEKE